MQGHAEKEEAEPNVSNLAGHEETREPHDLVKGKNKRVTIRMEKKV